jgi:hypothetical protein
MPFEKNNASLFLYVFIILIASKEKQVESVLFMKPFALSYFQSSKYDMQEIFQRFVEKIKLDKIRKEEKELDMKRNTIFHKYLASQISSSVLKDIYSRF